MISKSEIKSIKKLHQKKYRDASEVFIAEGLKVISEFLSEGFELVNCYATASNEKLPDQTITVSETDLKRISALTSPNNCLAIFKQPRSGRPNHNGLKLVLDAVRDPGNLGTIIRMCDWFGVEQLICSNDTVDCYNPKVVQASMGSLARIEVCYTNIKLYMQETELPKFGAFMDSTSVYKYNLPSEGILVMGNEGQGISKEVEDLIDKRISIPQFGKPTTESLNVATATAILLNEFRRSTEK